jgi:hypothetical protein
MAQQGDRENRISKAVRKEKIRVAEKIVGVMAASGMRLFVKRGNRH